MATRRPEGVGPTTPRPPIEEHCARGFAALAFPLALRRRWRTSAGAPGAPRIGRAYRVRSVAAKLALAPTILIMLCCYYASVTWTVYISMTRSFLLPVYKLAGAAQYERLFATPRWHVAYGNMFLFGVLDIIGTLGLGILLAVLLDRAVRFESVFR